MVETFAFTNEKHKFYNSMVQDVFKEGEVLIPKYPVNKNHGYVYPALFTSMKPQNTSISTYIKKL